MNAPLARYLTQFAAPPASAPSLMPTPFEPVLSLTARDLGIRLEAAAVEARAEAELQAKADTEALLAAHAAAAAEALVAARSLWVSEQAEVFAASLTDAMNALREMVADRTARILRPIASTHLVERTVGDLAGALDRLLTDPEMPVVSVRGPADLVEALKLRCADGTVEWTVADTCEVTVLADPTRIETNLAAALAELAGTDS